MMQEKDEVERIRVKYPFVDIVFGTYNIYRLAEILNRRTKASYRASMATVNCRFRNWWAVLTLFCPKTVVSH